MWLLKYSVKPCSCESLNREDWIEESLMDLKYSNGCNIFVLKDNLAKCPRWLAVVVTNLAAKL